MRVERSPGRSRSRGALSSIFWAAAVCAANGCGGSEKPLAMYDGTPVTAEDVTAELEFLLDDGSSFESLGFSPQMFLEQYVRLRILVEEAKSSFQGMTPDEEARFALYRESLIRDALVDELYPTTPAPDEARVQALYETRAEDEHEFDYVSFTSRAPADEVASWIESGMTFGDATARARAELSRELDGGTLGFNRRGELPPEWEEIAWDLDTGEVSGVVASSDGRFTILTCTSKRRTPLDVLRAAIVKELRDEVRAARRREVDAELLRAGRFQPDSSAIALVAERVAGHREAPSSAGGALGMPAFTPEELERPLFLVLGGPFTIEQLLNEIGDFEGEAWASGPGLETLHGVVRRRATSATLGAVAARRSIYQRPEIQARLERKEAEFVMNSLVREVWAGVGVTDAEVRERIRARGLTMPGDESIRLLTQRSNRESQAERLRAFVDEIMARHEVELHPDRLAPVLERFEAERRAPQRPAG